MQADGRLQHLLRVISLKIKISSDKRLEAFGLTLEQGHALGYIEAHEEGGLSQKDLEVTFKRRGSSISSVVNNLEKKGLIRRKADPKDERRKLLRVTDEGRQLVEQFAFEQYLKEVDQILLKGFTQDEAYMLFRLLERLEKNIDESSPEGSFSAFDRR